MLTSGLSMLILAGGGALLLLAALGLPFLLEGARPADTDSNDQMPSWPLESPAPSASVAPAWQGGAEEGSTWELPAGTPGQCPSDVTVAPPWNASPQPPNWGGPSASGSWESSLSAQSCPSPPGASTWDNQPPAQVQEGVGEPAPSWHQGTQPPSWPASPHEASGQGGVPFGAPAPQSPPAAVDPGQMGPTGEFPGPPGTTVPNAQGIGLEAAYPSPARGDSWPPQNAYRPPQADMNRSMAIGSPLSSGAWSGQSDVRRDPLATNRAADARANSPVPFGADESTGYGRTVSAAETPWSECLPTRQPPTSYPGATYPVAGQSAASEPVAEAPSGDRPMSTYAPAGPSSGATMASRFGALPGEGSRQPGVARLYGGIEKPTESNAYDQHRSRLY